MSTARRALWVASLAGLVACQATPPVNQGRTGYRMDPTRDHPSELLTLGLRSADLVTATDAMAQDIAGRLAYEHFDRPPRIVVGTIENRTDLPHQNYQVFLARLRALLMASGARHGLEFVRERAFVERQRRREYGHVSAAGFESRGDYLLTCVMYGLPSGGTRYYLLDYQLVQLRDADGGPDLGPGAIVWENKYEVKFQ